jgi:stage V sporulation protein D (sporulation-specific penicillin-binding protein)
MAVPAPKLKKRLLILLGFAAVLFLLLVFRLFQVQIIDGPRYESMALTQQTRRSAIQAQRGRILDTNGTVLAQSGNSYRVLVNPRVIDEDDEAEEEAERVRVSLLVSDILDLSYDEVYEKVSRTDKQQLVLKRQVSSDVVNEIIALNFDNGIITFSTDMTRKYSNGKLFAQLIGFTGIDGEGQTGLEASLDKYLAGENGRLVTPKDAYGNPLPYGEEEYIAPTNGYDVTLTVDTAVQGYLETALAECMSVNNAKTVTGIVMDPSTGEILATATNPTFDLNSPDRSDVTTLMAMSRNRSVTDTFEPGSIFKIITLAAALDSGVVTMDSTFECSGSLTFRTETIHCWSKHGHQTLTEACENSCNCAFMQMALAMGVDTFYDYIYAFGFGTSTESGIPGEDTGEVIHRKYVRDTDLARIGFGQSITTTPLQILTAASAAINGGILMQPYVVKSISSTDSETSATTYIEQNEPKELRRVISSDTSAKVRQILQSVVDNGSGSNAQIAGYTVGGKTGTAQKYDENGKVSSTLLIASFIGFVPADDPQLICLITVDEPCVPVVYGSTVAAPFVQRALSNLVQYYSIRPNTEENTELVEVPNVVGETAKQAAYILTRRGFPETIYVPSEEQATVIAQVPEAGTEVPEGTRVVIYTTMTTYSDEGTVKDLVKVPNLINDRRQDAFDKLDKLGLVLVYDKTACLGKIMTQSIPEGTEVAPGTEIYVEFDSTPSGTITPALNTTPTTTPSP